MALTPAAQDWLDHKFMEQAYSCASHSLDPRTQNGAVLVNPARNHIIADSWNRFPPGISFSQERWDDRDEKLKRVIHAETGAITKAAFDGKAVKGATLYCPWVICDRCAVVVIDAGVRRVVGHRDIMDFADLHTDNWRESIDFALGMLDEAGVTVDWIEGPVDTDVKVRIAGREFDPSGG